MPSLHLLISDPDFEVVVPIRIQNSYNINADHPHIENPIIGWVWKVASLLLPEFFTLIAINLYLMLSLLACLLEDRLPKAIPYIYQFVALAGYGNLLVSKSFLAVFNEYTRFWYAFIFLLIALANIVALNLYFAISKKLWTLAKVWASAVTFPTVLISIFFVSNYGLTLGAELPLLLLQIGLVLSAMLMGVCISIFLSPDLLRKLPIRKRR